MEQAKSPWLLALTPVMLCSTTMYAPFISLRHRFLYHCSGSPSAVLVALLVNLAVAYLAMVALLSLVDRFAPLRIAFWSVFIALLPYLLLHDEAILMDRAVPALLGHGLLLLAVAALLAEVLTWRRYFAARFNRVYAVVQQLTAVLSLAWLVTVGQLAYYAIAARGVNRPQPLHGGGLAAAAPDGRALQGKPRVIWVILDELGYDQLYGRRLPGLQLPAFDRLAAQAVNFTDAAAPGDFTEQVIPSLMLGQPAKKIAFTAAGKLLYQNTAGQPWQTFQARDTIFADALQEGYTTAVAGWHNPYCRLLSPVLDSCFWSSRADSATSEFDGQASFTTNLLGPLRRVATIAHVRGRSNLVAGGDREYRERHIADVKALLRETDRLLATPAADFLLIHIPVPHPAGIYDRQRGVLSADGAHLSYADNLALADRVLAHLRDELTARGEWDPSLVLVMGDHAWRTRLLWIQERSWTPEDQLASHGGAFDPRPAYLVKLPNEQAGVVVGQSFPTLRTRALLEAVMHGTLHTPAELQAWVAQGQ